MFWEEVALTTTSNQHYYYSIYLDKTNIQFVQVFIKNKQNLFFLYLIKKNLLVLRYQRPITYKASSAFFEYGWNSIIGMENKISSLWIVCVQILIVKCVVHVNFPLIKAASVMCEVSLSQYTAWMDWQVGYISVL